MIVLDGEDFKSQEEFYRIMNETFHFENEVSNLDGLFESLVEVREKIRVKNYKRAYDHLGEYGRMIMIVFVSAAFTLDTDVDLIC
ncbi:MAG: barstar family protein [Anaerococcus sp.]|nr:barstar family protein [Anaerococcus sp.]MDD7043858.1 barstar family protein [Peptoniphilaceae bacterium]MDY2919522.1 barstar family protein [Anaerococcus sp.]